MLAFKRSITSSMNRRLRTILIMLSVLVGAGIASAQEHFGRNFEQVSFVPKGQWLTGVSVSYSHSSQNDYQFLVIEGINGDSYSYKISPMAMYCFKDNLAAGMRFSYQRQRTHLDRADVVIDSETSYNVEGLYSISHNYYGTAAFRNYISMGTSKRFGIFTEMQLQIGGGESKLCNGYGEDLTGTFGRSFSLDVGVAPGLVMFLNNYSAIEVNVGVLGFSYDHTRQVTDRIYVAHYNSKSANFKINLFSITFGVTFYL